MSIKPQFFNKLLSGEKTVEYRKVAPKNVDKIYLYVSSPIREIKAILYIEKTIKDSPIQIWEKTKLFSGIDENTFFKYCKNKDVVYAIFVSSIKLLNKKIELKKFTAPQNYIFRQDEEFSNLDKKE